MWQKNINYVLKSISLLYIKNNTKLLKLQDELYILFLYIYGTRNKQILNEKMLWKIRMPLCKCFMMISVEEHSVG